MMGKFGYRGAVSIQGCLNQSYRRIFGKEIKNNKKSWEKEEQLEQSYTELKGKRNIAF